MDFLRGIPPWNGLEVWLAWKDLLLIWFLGKHIDPGISQPIGAGFKSYFWEFSPLKIGEDEAILDEYFFVFKWV